MDEKTLKRFQDCLDYFHVEWRDDVIKLHDGGHSVILNQNFEFSDFCGYSINSIAEAVAKQMGKSIEWVDY